MIAEPAIPAKMDSRFMFPAMSQRGTSLERGDGCWRSLQSCRGLGEIPCDWKSRWRCTGTRHGETINVEAGLDRYCKMEKKEFIWRAALRKLPLPDCTANWSDCK
jgi:hypothetical protein